MNEIYGFYYYQQSEDAKKPYFAQYSAVLEDYLLKVQIE